MPIDTGTTIDLKAAFEKGAPDGYIWRFSPDLPTFLQTDSIRDGEARWYLTQARTDDPAYWLEVPPTPEGIVDVLAQVGDKNWTNKGQLLDALLPAIRAVRNTTG